MSGNLSTQSRVFVGGYPGSGTRAIQKIMEVAGYFIGDLNIPTLDYLPLDAVKYNLIMGENIWDRKPEEYLPLLFGSWWGKHEKWSIKQGFLMLCMPELRKAYPEARFIMTVRHGIDNILNIHNPEVDIGHFALPRIMNIADELERKILFWSWWHEKALLEMEDDTLIVKLEDLVANPEGETDRIMRFLGENCDITRVSGVIRDMGSIGRRNKETALYPRGILYVPELDKERLYELAEPTLTKFGYTI